MSVRQQIPEKDGIYFITITCYQWLNLFQVTKGYDVVYKWFDNLKDQGHYIIGYVIMPNHFHTTIGFCNTGRSINKIIGNGKRFMAYSLVKLLQEANQKDLLLTMQRGVKLTDKSRGKLHEVFQPSFDWKECISNRFIEQKLEYIHENPCQGKWNLVENSMDYLHSSAQFYNTGIQGAYEVTDYMEMEDIDLTTRRSGG